MQLVVNLFFPESGPQYNLNSGRNDIRKTAKHFPTPCRAFFFFIIHNGANHWLGKHGPTRWPAQSIRPTLMRCYYLVYWHRMLRTRSRSRRMTSPSCISLFVPSMIGPFLALKIWEALTQWPKYLAVFFSEEREFELSPSDLASCSIKH